MTVSIRSLKIMLDGDSSGYVRAMGAKAVADAKAIAAGQHLVTVIEQTDRRLGQSVSIIDRLAGRYVDGARATHEFERSFGQLGRAIERDNSIAERAGSIYEGLARKTGIAADAADIAARGNLALADAVSRVNLRLAAQQERAERTAAAMKAADAASAAGAGLQAQLTGLLAYGARLEEVRAKHVPLFAAQQQYRAQLADVAEALKLGAITEAEYTAAIGQTKAAFANQVRELTGAAAKARETAASQAALARDAQLLKDKLNPLAAAEREYAAAVDLANRAQRAGHLSATEHGAALALARTNLDHATEAAKRHSGALGTATASTGQMRASLVNLGQQAQDVFVTLSAGQSPLQVLIQQGSQIGTIFAATPGGAAGVLSAAGAAIRGMITPTTLAVAGLAALASGAALVVAHAARVDTQIRTFAVALDAMHTSSLASGADFLRMTRELQAMGLAADDARASLLEVVRTPGVNPAVAGRIVATGANIAAGIGGDPAARAKELAVALAGGIEKTIEFGIATETLDHIQAGQLRTMAQVQGSTAATTRAFETMEAAVAGRLNRSLSATTRALAELKSAFGSMLDSLVLTTPVQTFIRGLENLAKIVDHLAKGDLKLGPITLDLGPFGSYPLNQSARDAAGAQAAASPTAVLPGATNAFDPRGLALDTADLRRLATVLDAAVKHLPEGHALLATSTIARRPDTPGSDHPIGKGIDVRLVGPNGPLPNKGPIGSDPGLYERLAAAAYLENQRLYPGTPLAWGGRFETKKGSGLEDWMHFGATEDRGTLRPPLSAIAERYRPELEYRKQLAEADSRLPELTAWWRTYYETVGNVTDNTAEQRWAAMAAANKAAEEWRARNGIAAPPAATSAAGPTTGAYDKDALNKLSKAIELSEKLRDADRLTAHEGRTYWQAYWQAMAGPDDGSAERRWSAMSAANDAVEQWRITVDRAAAAEKTRTDGVMATAQATLQGEVPALIAAADAQARLALQTGETTNVEAKRRQLLQGLAAEEIKAAAEAVAGMRRQTEASEALAAATQRGAGAEHEATIQAQVTAATYKAANAAKAAGIDVTDGVVRAIAAETEALVRRNDAAKNAAELGRAANDNRRGIEVLQLEASLAGKTTEEIQARVSHLQAVQELERRNVDLSGDVAKNYLASVDALGEARIRTAAVQRESQRWEEAIRGIASTIESALTGALERSLSGERAEDWGKRLRSILNSALTGLAVNLFIRPAIGTALGALGFGNLAQQYGTFGGSAGGSGASANGSSGLGTVSNVAGLGNSLGLFDGLKDSIFGSGGIGSWFSGIGKSLGFASQVPVVGLSQSSIASLANMIGIEPASLSYLGSAGSITVPGSVFGTTTLGSFAGAPGSGIPAGNLTENFV